MKFTFWGVRGSLPSPSTENFSTIKYGGNTTCVTCEFDKHLIIIDAGTGITRFGMNTKQTHFLLLFSHFHHDHVQGFPFFFPIYNPKTIIHYFSPRIMKQNVHEVLAGQFNPPLFPYRFEYTGSSKFFLKIEPAKSIRLVNIQSDKEFLEVFDPKKENPKIITKIKEHFPDGYNAFVYADKQEAPLPYEIARIDFVEIRSHPDYGSYSYIISTENSKIVFITDLEQRIDGYHILSSAAQDADVLIHDAQYVPEDYHKYQDFGHSTYEMACDFAIKCKVKELILTHFDPWHSDTKVDSIIERSKNYLAEKKSSIQLSGAQEGREINLP